jgi:hypothetical protein
MSMRSPVRSLPPSATEPSALQGTVAQIRTIGRATFDGFLQSDLMPQGMQAPALIWAAAFFVAPALFLPVKALNKYSMIRRFFPERLEATFWDDRVLFLVMSAGAVGIVAVVLWDTLFPARRDAFVLTPLPVPLSAQMLGRLAGLVALCLLFVVALNAIPSVLFPITSSGTAAEMPRAMIGHAVAMSAADVFVFFSVTSLQGIVILALGRRIASRIASVAQAASVLVLLLGLLFIGSVQHLTRNALEAGSMSDPALQFLPAAWFLGLYEWIVGNARPIMAPLAGRAVIATILPVAITAAIYAFGYKRLLARAVETPQRSTRSWLTVAGSCVVRKVFVRRPEEQAIAAFLLRAISRSGRHSMLMAIYLGVGLALMVTAVLPDVVRLGNAALTSPAAPWPHRSNPPIGILMLPLILSAALACGARILMAIPAEMNARWVFQTASLTPLRVDAGTHKALLLLVLPPVIATALLTAGPLWGWKIALLHAIYATSLSLMLCEILLLTYRGLPLTRAYVPGGSRFHLLWALYISGFINYTYTTTLLERDLLSWQDPTFVLRGAGFFAAVGLAFWTWRKLKVRDLAEVTFEAEIPEDQMFQGFNLSEIQAAQAVAAHGEQRRG